MKIIRKLLMENIPLALDALKHPSKPRLEYWETKYSPFVRVLLGEIMLFVEVQNADDISRIVGLKKLVELKVVDGLEGNGTYDGMKMSIVGGAEAWVVAEDLGVNNVDVILRPPRCTPGSWATRQCRVPGTVPSAVDILHDSGVKV
jgi:hypothetical protein